MANTFKDIITETPLVLVDFHAEWCGPCKMMKPILDQLKSEVNNSVRILKVDVDKNKKLAQSLNVQSVPTLVLYKQGKITWRKSGVVQASELKTLINSNQ